ncbi:hypothetical protein Tco_1132794 [Tanacetum coccineum]|uniref:Uncharacterized protein n=1 Tax=Tanacetum coccineum TaxID=301880 RepID=A0ABQ5JG03_9ASTR
MVVYLAKPTESEGFEQIIGFLNASSIRYALTVNPTVYVSCIGQFWTTSEVKKVNGEAEIHAIIDGKRIVVSEAKIASVHYKILSGRTWTNVMYQCAIAVSRSPYATPFDYGPGHINPTTATDPGLAYFK